MEPQTPNYQNILVSLLHKPRDISSILIKFLFQNSIRHNLSLHQKFVKIPNEGAGKSSWWSLNLENNPVRKPRRRATSGDVKMLQARRERVRNKAEAFKQPEK